MVTVLIVEDNEMNRDMLSRRLTKRGYHIILAEDGTEGLELATQKIPDIILMDLSLPGMDGYEATRRLRSHPSTREIPIIALSAHVRVEDINESIKSGCNEYETKPVELERLIKKMEVLLKGSPIHEAG